MRILQKPTERYETQTGRRALRLMFALCTVPFALASHAAPVQWTSASGGNDHWYEYIDNAVNWPAARAAALASSYLGMSGYLATITSADEQSFLINQNWNVGWVGGSDEEQEGVWKWMDGPEAGTIFWNNGPVGAYTNWNCYEPNEGGGGEDYLEFNRTSCSTGWNDMGGPGYNARYTHGYVIEYSQWGGNNVPEPGSLALFGGALALLAGLRRRISV